MQAVDTLNANRVLVLGYMCAHRWADDVVDHGDAGYLGFAVTLDDGPVGFHAEPSKAEAMDDNADPGDRALGPTAAGGLPSDPRTGWRSWPRSHRPRCAAHGGRPPPGAVTPWSRCNPG